MSVTIPDPRFEAPELFEPGRKPVGNVVIDWSHQLAKHITHIFMPTPNFRDDLLVVTPTITVGLINLLY